MHTQSIPPIFIFLSLSLSPFPRFRESSWKKKRWLRALNSDRKNKEMLLNVPSVEECRLGALLPVTAAPAKMSPPPPPLMVSL
jgi:hypothetical protein